MPRNSQKSSTPTSTKSNRLSKLLKKRDKKKDKAAMGSKSKSQYHLEMPDDIDTPPIIAHRKSSPFMMNSSIINNIDPYQESSDEQPKPDFSPINLSSPPQRGRSQSHRQYMHHPHSQQAQMQKLEKFSLDDNSNTNHLNTPSQSSSKSNKTIRNVPPPPPPPKKQGHKKSNTTTASMNMNMHNIINREKASQSVTHRATYTKGNDNNNININIDINNKDHHSAISPRMSNKRRSRHNSVNDDARYSPHSPHSPHSPTDRFVAHTPRRKASIEHKINMKQLIVEMLEMKRQIKSLKKDVKYLKTENNLCHRRITFLEQTLAANDKNKRSNIQVPTYPIYPQQSQQQQSYQFLYTNDSAPPAAMLQPQPDPNTMTQMNLGPSMNPMQTRPKRLSLSSKEGIPSQFLQQRTGRSVSMTTPTTTTTRAKVTPTTKMEIEELNLNKDEDVDMETKLRRLSRKLSTANVFSDEYKRLQFELETLIQQSGYEQEYQQVDEEVDGGYNDKTLVVKKRKPRREKHLWQKGGKYDESGSESDGNPFDAIDDDEKGVMDEETKELKSLCTLSRRSTNKLVSKKEKKEGTEKRKDEVYRRRKSTSGMEIVD